MGTASSAVAGAAAERAQEAAWTRYERFLTANALEKDATILLQYHTEEDAASALAALLEANPKDLIAQAKTLRIACNWLTSLNSVFSPKIVDKLRHITSLDAQNNPLNSTQSQSALAAFTNLTFLRLSRNSLTKLPSEVAALTNLTELHAEECSLMEFPLEVYKLTKLRVLDLSHNALPKVPEGLGALSELTELDLSHNNLWEDALPDSLSNLSRLTTLKLDHNALLSFPSALPALTTLTYLGLNQTKVIKKAADITRLSSLTNLEVLCLAHNNLGAFPDLTSLLKLKRVDLGFNKIDSVPSSAVEGLTQLQKVNLLMNNLTKLPEALMELPSLKVLVLRGNSIELDDDTTLPTLKMLGSVAALRCCNDAVAFNAVLDAEEADFLKTSSDRGQSISNVATILASTRPAFPDRGNVMMPDNASTLSRNDLVDRILGVIFGTALGDAVGLATEFMTRETALYLYDPPLTLGQVVRDRHRCMWIPGDWTDDTDQMLLLLDNLIIHNGKANEKVFAEALLDWMNRGIPSHGDYSCSGMGSNTFNVLRNAHFLDNPFRAAREVWEASGKMSAANGAVMRTGVVGIPHFWSLDVVISNARTFSHVTHADPKCAASAIAVATAIAQILQGAPVWTDEGVEAVVKRCLELALPELESSPVAKDAKDEFVAALNCTHIREMALDDGQKIGYTYKALGSGFWALRQTSFEGMMTALAFEAGDADTNGAVAGAMLGAKLGYSQLPQVWLRALPHHDWLMAKAYALLDALGL